VILMFGMAPFNALLPRIVRGHFHRGVGSYGLLFTLMATGMVLGSLTWARVNPRRHRIAICYAGFATGALGLAAVGFAPWYWLVAAAVVWRGFFIGIGMAAWNTLLLEYVPQRLLSRVFSLDFFGSIGLTPVGYAGAAAVATVVDPRTILTFGGCVAFVGWSTPILFRSVRSGVGATRAPSTA
jgi:MFS family permease